MESFVETCISNHPELNKVCFINITDGHIGYDIEIECKNNVVAGLYPTDTWEIKSILSLCDSLTEELLKREIKVIENREEWELLKTQG